MDAGKSRIELLRQYLLEDPSDNFSQYALALEYARENLRKEAILLLEQLLTRKPDYLSCYNQLGKLYETEGKQAEAINIFQKGIEIARKQKNKKTLGELQTALDSLED